MLNRLITAIVRVFERWLPDSFVIAVLLTLLTFALAIGLTDTTPIGAVEAWGDGFWNLLAFTNQIALTLLLGYALASTRPVNALLLRTAGLVRSARMAYITVCLLTGLIALLSWSTALVAAGIMSRAVGEACRQRGIHVHYPLLVASAFSGFVVWHQGISASIGLAIATPGHFLQDQIGIIPTSETLFSLWNLLTVTAILLSLPVLMALLHPRDPAQITEIPDHLMREMQPDPDTDGETRATTTPALRLERSRLLALAIAALGLVYLYIHYIARGDGLTLNLMNFSLLTVGILCAGNLDRYARITVDGGRIAAPFLVEYPFYAGIAGLIASSGLGAMVVAACASVADADSLPLFAFFSGGLLNIFIPSGGAQWAVQGPIMMTVADQIGASLPATAMAVSLGDEWTNLIQPLIMLPVLTLARVSARSVMGYSFVALLWSGLIFVVSLSVI